MTRKDERKAAELTALIRETAGPDVEILIDAHGRFDVPTAIRLCRSLEEAGQIDWFEEPCPPESLNALKQVREKVSAPISWGERGHTKWDFVPVLEQAGRLHHAGCHLDGRHYRAQEDFRSVRSLLHSRSRHTTRRDRSTWLPERR